MHPERKANRLADYDYSQPGAYFITICTENRKCILSTVVGGDAHIAPHTVLTETGKTVEKYLRSIPGIGHYVIMPNHVHMILRISAKEICQGPIWRDAPTEASVPKIIRSWKILVSKELGHSIWQRNYYDRIIRDEQEYIQKMQYITDNPAKWREDDYYSHPV